MSEQKIEEITNVLKEVVVMSFEDRELQKKKFIPHPPAEDFNKKKQDPEKAGANIIEITKGNVLLNTLTPREQEREGTEKELEFYTCKLIFINSDENVIKGLNHLFDNEFMTAKAIFEEKADWYA